MFKSLREKLGNVVQSFKKEVEEEVEELPEEEVKGDIKEPEEKSAKEEKKEETEKEEEPEKDKKKEKGVEESKKEPEKKEDSKKQESQKEDKEQPKESKSFFKHISDKVTKFNLSEDKFEDLFWDLEVALLENNVAMEVIGKIKSDLKDKLTSGKISRKGVEEVIKGSLRKSIEEVLDIESFDLVKKAKDKQPFIITFIGVNGSGKTTSLAKVAKKLMDNGLSVVFAAADTFRAAAIQQLEEHANNLDVKMIKHDYNADPAAVAFDAVEHAKSKGIDVVLVDTAGRLHSNKNLMQELEKLIRVNNPDLKIFVGESITGNDCVEQAKVYDEAIGIDAIILSKADVDEKGGAAISVSYVTGKPILYIGTGQEYDDLERFEPDLVLESLDL